MIASDCEIMSEIGGVEQVTAKSVWILWGNLIGVGVRQKLAACMQESSCLCIIVRFHCCNACQLGVYIFTGKLGRNSFSSVCIRFHIAPIYCGFILRPNLLSGSFNKTFVATNSTICHVSLFVKVSHYLLCCFICC